MVTLSRVTWTGRYTRNYLLYYLLLYLVYYIDCIFLDMRFRSCFGLSTCLQEGCEGRRCCAVLRSAIKGLTDQQEEKLKHVSFPGCSYESATFEHAANPPKSHHGATMNVWWRSYPTIPPPPQHLLWREACFGEEAIVVSIPQPGCCKQTEEISETLVLLWRRGKQAWCYVCQREWR